MFVKIIKWDNPLTGKYYNQIREMGMPFYQGTKDFTDRIYWYTNKMLTTRLKEQLKMVTYLMSVRAPVGNVILLY